MNSETIEPFEHSVSDTLLTMFGVSAERCKESEVEAILSNSCVLSSVTLEGIATGTVVMTFPGSTAIGLVNQLMGTGFVELNSDVLDGVGEILNMVAGSAKSRFAQANGAVVKLGVPDTRTTTAELQEIPGAIGLAFATSLGPFCLFLNLASTTDAA